MNVIFIYGGSGHSKVIIEIAESLGIHIGGLIDSNPNIKEVYGYPVISDSSYDFEQSHWVIGIGNNAIRKEISLFPSRIYTTLVHPFSSISKRVQIGDGTVIMAGAVVNSNVKVGRHCIINTNSSVDHDCILEDYVHISPNVALAGNVSVGEGTHVGIGACIKQGVQIGKWCIIGAGAVIIRDVPDGDTVVGNPGKSIR